jgi:hypothetical protein
MGEFMKHAVETASGGIIYTLSFIHIVKIMKFRHSKLLGRIQYAYTYVCKTSESTMAVEQCTFLSQNTVFRW